MRLPRPTLPRAPLAARARPLTDDPLRRPSSESGNAVPPASDAVAPFDTLPKWNKLLKMGLSPADIAAETAHFKSYAGKRNCYAWDEATWFTLAKHSTRSVPIPNEAIAKAATELPMLFPFAFGADEEKALVNLVKSWGMDEVPAIDAANAILRTVGMPMQDETRNVEDQRPGEEGVDPYATKAGRKLGVPFEVDIPCIPGGTPDSDDEYVPEYASGDEEYDDEE